MNTIKLKEISEGLNNTEQSFEMSAFKETLMEGLNSIKGFTNLFSKDETKNYKNIDVGTIERCWNIAKNDELGIGDKLKAIFYGISESGVPKDEKHARQVRRLNKIIAYKNKVAKKLKETLDDKQASWSYIKAGAIFIIIGLIIGIGNNPDMLNSASKKALSTARYVGKISVSKNNINVAARGFSHLYIRVMKFIDENQAFTMCFMAGIFLIGVGIWKRYW